MAGLRLRLFCSLEDITMMKSGANLHDIKVIEHMFAEGRTAEEISESVQIELECVKSFEPAEPVKVEQEEPEVKGSKSDVKDPVAAALAAAASGDKE